MKRRTKKQHSVSLDAFGFDAAFRQIGFGFLPSGTSDDEGRQMIADQELAKLKAEFDRGINSAVLRAVNECATWDVKMPKWLRVAYMERFEKVERLDVNSWDAAFGRPFRKSAQIAKERKRQKRSQVYEEVVRALEDGKPLTNDTFDSVGKKLGIGRTLCRELFESTKTLQLDGSGQFAWLPYKRKRKKRS
jgi:galactokinase